MRYGVFDWRCSKICEEGIREDGDEFVEVRIEELGQLLEWLELVGGVSNAGDDSREWSTKLTSRSASLVLTLPLIWGFPDFVVFQRNGFRDRWRSASSSGDVLCNWTSCSTSAASIVRGGDVYEFMAGFERRRRVCGCCGCLPALAVPQSTTPYLRT
jgi:hypothetical protein